MSLICSILTWYLKKQTTQENSSLKLNPLLKSDDDFLSLFGNFDNSEPKISSSNIHKKRVYSMLKSTDIKEI